MNEALKALLSRKLESAVTEPVLRRVIREQVWHNHNNYLFAGSDAGGERAAALYSLIGTATLDGIDPHVYLRHVLECIDEHPVNRIEELLPWHVDAKLAPVTARAT